MKDDYKYVLAKKGPILGLIAAVFIFIIVSASIFFPFEIKKYLGFNIKEIYFILFTVLIIILFFTWLGWIYQFRQRNIYRTLFLKEKELRQLQNYSENMIRESVARLKRAELISRTGNWEIHLDTGLVTASDGAKIVYGVDKNELTLSEIQKFPLVEYRPILDRALQDLIEKDIPYEVEFKIRNAESGELRDIHSVAEYDKEKRILFGIFKDITEEIRNRNELVKAKEKAEEMSRLKTNFLSNMSHELRTPMIGILGFSDMLRSEIEDLELKNMADSIHVGGKRLLNTLNLVLDLARIESNKELIDIEKVNLHELLCDMLRTFEMAAQLKNLFLKCDTTDKNIYAYLDKRIFGQVINNLVNNAIKFTNEGGITIQTGIESNKDKHCCVIKVIDTGIGISAKDLNIIFEEFRQASEGIGRSFEGTGLGLTITKKSVELMNGTINVESVLGKGTTFFIRFPVPYLDDESE
jgi:signal transduction histidine kinase